MCVCVSVYAYDDYFYEGRFLLRFLIGKKKYFNSLSLYINIFMCAYTYYIFFSNNLVQFYI